MRSGAAAVLVAAALDVAFGEPPVRWHPVVVAGRWLDGAGRRVPSAPPARSVLAGGLAWGTGAAAALVLGRAAERAADRLPRAAGAPVAGLALWPLLSGTLLLREVAAVEAATARSLEQGRDAVARIVSRDTTGLTEDEVRAAALESLSENLSDSVVAPLFWYCVGGLPAAAAYRYANTADAMWGYRSPRWEHAGKVAARADDVLNLVPARLTALGVAGARRAMLRRLPAEARRTPSPNAGWPMGALALRLGVRLEKPGAYVLNPAGRAPEAPDVARALAVARGVIAAAVVVAACVSGSKREVKNRSVGDS